ncbi:MAG: fibrillarin-like rRNA/tRNA 2'-O-methyltransferase [Candidatus Micrarchaeota archaeon]|nr:fibrillarin-like rRNA/tRNA 2'-O-methyltransferase [Candidatus Micrarchaeota archaeon]
MQVRELFSGIYMIDNRLATANLARGKKTYGEDLITENRTEYRSWNPYRSKLSAAILNGIKNVKIERGSSVLYLGAATGTTVSHVSDIVGAYGRVYAVELSERNVRNLIALCESRRNIIPILSDARYIEGYSGSVDLCDVIYQDISARRQAEILLANSSMLKRGGYAYFVIKSQSIDISKSPKDVYRNELALLKEGFELVEQVSLEPYDSMHLFVVLRKL